MAALIEHPTLMVLEYPLYDRLQTFRTLELKQQVVLISTDTERFDEGPVVDLKQPEKNLLLEKIHQLGATSVLMLTDPPTIRTLPEEVQLPPARQLLAELNNPFAALRCDRPELSSFPFSAAETSAHLVFTPDSDGKIRHQALFLPQGSHLLPALPLQLFADVHAFPLTALKLIPRELDGNLKAGPLTIPVQGYYRLAFDLSHPQPPFQKYSYRELVDDLLPTDSLHSKIVLVGPTAGFGDRHPVAGYGPMSTSEMAALATSTLFNATAPRRPHWSWAVETGVLIFFAMLLIFMLPRLSLLPGLMVLVFFLAAWTATAVSVMVMFGIWFKMVPAGVLCLCGFIVVHWCLNSSARDLAVRENSRTLIQRFKDQGLLDLALEKALLFRPGNKSDRELLYTLGLDFERKRKTDNAAEIYRHLLRFGRFRDAKNRLQQMKRFDDPRHNLDGQAETSLLGPGRIKPTLGRYRIEKALGQGAMGTVYLGIDPKINRQVAIKTLEYAKLEKQELKKTKERFFREAEAAGRLNHPHVVTIYDVGEENDLAFLAMELLDGDDLSRINQSGKPLSTLQIVDIINQVASALNYAHQQGVIHRDIKPANIIRLANGRIKVADFGIARIASAAHTETGIILGTPTYMSPEQIAGKEVDGRSDLFSLGVVMYELLTGEKPFQGETLTALMYNISHSKYPPLAVKRQDLPADCYKIVDKLLQKSLTRRYKSAAALQQDIHRLTAELGQ